VTRYIGIDPGMDGGIVVLDSHERCVIAIPMPTINVASKGKRRTLDLPALVAVLRDHAVITTTDYSTEPIARVIVEKVSSRPGEGAAASFQFGRCYGAIEAVLTALGASWSAESPQSWQKAILAGVEGDDTKARAVLVAQRRLPTVPLVLPRCRTPHSGIADAACIALYAMRSR
jgi:hypothetical protein